MLGADGIQEDAVLEIDAGRVTTLGQADAWDEDLGNALVIPGLVNAHSHAFQRTIRGKTEWLDVSRAEDDFWSWRDRMYSAALSLEAECFYNASKLAFDEMIASGITSVGEFHYIHHRPDGTPYADRNRLSHLVIEAARDAGLRISLLLVAYQRAGFERGSNPQQRRFVEKNVETFLERFHDLRTRYAEDPNVRVGMAPHSIRAVPSSWLEAMANEGNDETPIHVHACEQRREIEESQAEYGRTPVGVLSEAGLFDRNLTLIHATHLSDEDLDLLEGSRVGVCACPTTERNLGDGFLPAVELVERGVPISLGSDSHTNIDLFEEMRLVEYHERLRYEERNVLARVAWENGHLEARGERANVEDVVWPMSTRNGALSIGFDDAGVLEAGASADFAVIDCDHISLRHNSRDDILSNVIFSMPWTCVRETWVAGNRVL